MRSQAAAWAAGVHPDRYYRHCPRLSRPDWRSGSGTLGGQSQYGGSTAVLNESWLTTRAASLRIKRHLATIGRPKHGNGFHSGKQQRRPQDRLCKL